MKRLAAGTLLVLSGLAQAQPSPPPIIDMHLHAYGIAEFTQLLGPAPVPHCVPMTDYPVPPSGTHWEGTFKARELPCTTLLSPTIDEQLMARTLEIMERHNIYGVTSGNALSAWRAAAPDRIVPSLEFSGGPGSPSVDAARASFQAGDYEVFGEVLAQYGGVGADDPLLDPYWALAAELGIPVGIHIGPGPVGAPYLGFGGYRARLHSPLALEEVLVRHPGLRVYVMHAGWPMLDDLLALLWAHPQVYVDLGVIDWALPRAEFHRYLQRIVEAGFGKRVMFGSDQMIWPDALVLAIEGLESADFLSPGQKRDIFFHNAARFLQLPPERVAAMQH